jgi:hypothetical protein
LDRKGEVFVARLSADPYAAWAEARAGFKDRLSSRDLAAMP